MASHVCQDDFHMSSCALSLRFSKHKSWPEPSSHARQPQTAQRKIWPPLPENCHIKLTFSGTRGTPSMNIKPLSPPQRALLRMLFDHTCYAHKPWTHRTCCWQGNSAEFCCCTLMSNEEQRSHEASTFFRSSIFCSFWLSEKMSESDPYHVRS